GEAAQRDGRVEGIGPEAPDILHGQPVVDHRVRHRLMAGPYGRYDDPDRNLPEEGVDDSVIVLEPHPAVRDGGERGQTEGRQPFRIDDGAGRGIEDVEGAVP